MGEMKPTPGPCEAHGNLVRSSMDPPPGVPRGVQIAECRDSYFLPHSEEAKDNARLFADAINVHHNTGLSPVQLVEQRDELLAACKKLVEWEAREKDHAIGFMERINLCEAAFQMMYAALAKCEGVGNG